MTEQKKGVALVTGGAWGIGGTISKKLALENYHVVIADINGENGQRLQEEIREKGGDATFLNLDLSQPLAAQKLWSAASAIGSVTALINNARSGARKPILEESEEDFDTAMQVTLKFAFFLSQQILKDASENPGPRAIVSIASVTAEKVTIEESATYHIAKAGILQMSRYFAAAGGEFGLRSNAVSPGFIVKDEHREKYSAEDNATYRKWAEAAHPVNAIGSSNDIAEAVAFLISDRSQFTTGQNLTVDGGLCIQDPSALLMRHKLNEQD